MTTDPRIDAKPADGDLGYLLTAYADGQLAPEGVAWIEDQLKLRPDLQARLDEIRAMQQTLRDRFAVHPAPTALEGARIESLLAAAAKPAKKLRFPVLRMAMPSWTLLAAACLVVVLMAGMMLPSVSLVREMAHRQKMTREEYAAKNGGIDAWMPEADNAESPPMRVTTIEPHSAPMSFPGPDLAIPEPGVAYDRPMQEKAKAAESSTTETASFGIRAGGGGQRAIAKGGGVDRKALAPAPAAAATPAPTGAPMAKPQARYLEDRPELNVEGEAQVTAPINNLDIPYDVVTSSEDDHDATVANGREEAVGNTEMGGQGAFMSIGAGGGSSGLFGNRTGGAKRRALAQYNDATDEKDKEIQSQRDATDKLAEDGRAVVNQPVTATGPMAGAAPAKPGAPPPPPVLAPNSPATTPPSPTTGQRYAVIARPSALARQPKLAEAKKAVAEKQLQNRAQAMRQDAAKAKPRSSAKSLPFDDSEEQDEKPVGEAAARDGYNWGTDSPKAMYDPEEDSKHAGSPFFKSGQRPPLSPADLGHQLAATHSSFPIGVTSFGSALKGFDIATGDTIPFLISPAGQFGLMVKIAPPQGDLPAGKALLQIIRGANLQMRPVGGGIEIYAATTPLDPTDLFGLEREVFRSAFGTAPMTATSVDAQSTFALDADTASYQLARARLRAGQRVDPSAIQAEHFINAMPMDYPAASGPEAFTLYAEAAPSPFAMMPPPVPMAVARDAEQAAISLPIWSRRTSLVAVGAVARPAGPDERRPLHFTLAIDCSGSMAQEGGLARIQLGLNTLITHLRPDDRVAVVAFGDRAQVVLPATPGTDADRLIAAINSLTPAGSTNCAEGLALAYQLAAESADPGAENRVILATDGATLAGDDAPAVLERITAYKARGITLLVVGCGAEHYQMQPLTELANKGDGQHIFLGSDDEARQVFSTTLLPERLSVLARDAKVQVTWNPARVSHFRLIGYEKRRLAHRDFRNDAVDAGEISHDTQVTALYEVLLVDGATGPLGTAAVRYFDTRLRQVRELPCPMPGSVLKPVASDRLRLLACAAEFAELLQQGWWSNVHCATPERIIYELGRCPGPAASELVDLVRRAANVQFGRAIDMQKKTQPPGYGK